VQTKELRAIVPETSGWQASACGGEPFHKFPVSGTFRGEGRTVIASLEQLPIDSQSGPTKSSNGCRKDIASYEMYTADQVCCGVSPSLSPFPLVGTAVMVESELLYHVDDG
jgi:hypothetical protein